MASLTPESFRLLPQDGAQFEALVSQLLTALGYQILEKPAVGTDGGRDVLVERALRDLMVERKERVLVQCKHHAHSGKAVGDKDVRVWENAMKRHRARGYLLVTNTRVTENLSRAFREYTNDESNPNWANFWDVDELITLLNAHTQLRDSFFPPNNLTRTPLEELANEVHAWLSSMRYEITAPIHSGTHTIDMSATLKQGTIKQKIFVRCLGREVRTRDVEDLSKSLRRQKAQGWLVTDKQVSKKARELSARLTNIEIHNLAEILRTMIWAPYLRAITKAVDEEKITLRYVDPGCYTVETNDQGKELSREVYDSLDEYVDDWLNEQGQVHISLLGEFGAGKTWFGLHYASRQLERFFKNPVKERFPLLITLRMFNKATTAQQLINDALLETYGLRFIGGAYKVFDNLNRQGKLLLLLDGFDEMAQRVDYQVVVNNFWELVTLVDQSSKVVLTSRSEYFRWARESEKLLTGGETTQRGLQLDPTQFDILYIEEFDDERIREVIVRRLGQDRGAEVATEILSTPNLAELARKPLLIQLLLAALDEVKAQRLENQGQVYLYATNRLLLRNIHEGKTFLSTADKLYFLCELAWEMMETGESRIHYTSIPARIKTHFGSRIKDQHELDLWDYDLRSQTLLHRDVAGYYSFAHKSLTEYFVALKFTAELGCLDQRFANTYLECNEIPCQVPFEVKTAEQLSKTFGAIPLQARMSTVKDFVVSMLAENAAENLWDLILSTQGKTFDEVRYVGGNCLSLLSEANQLVITRPLDGLILAGARIGKQSLPSVEINATDFDDAEFYRINLSEMRCSNTSFRRARFSNVNLRNGEIEGSDFTDVVLEHWDYIYSLSYSPDGLRIASGGDRKEVAIWDNQSGLQLLTLPGSKSSTQHVSFSPKGTFLASGGGDGVCHLRDSFTGKTVWQKNTAADFIRSVAFHPSERLLVTTGDDNTLTVWETASGRVSATVGIDAEGLCVCFSPSGDILAVGTRQGTIFVFETTHWKRIKRWRAHGQTLFGGFNSSGTLLISGGSERGRHSKQRTSNTMPHLLGRIHVWEVGSWHKLGEIQTSYRGGWMKGSVSPVHPYVAAQIDRANAGIWNYQTGERVFLLESHHGTVFTTLFSPDGQTLATCSRDGSICQWNVDTGKLRTVITMDKSFAGTTIKYPNGLNQIHKEWFSERGAMLVE